MSEVRRNGFGSWRLASLALAVAVLSAGCHTDMWTQPKALPQQDNDILPGKMVSQLPPEGTIARGRLREDEAFFTGFKDKKLVTALPKTLKIEGKDVSTVESLVTVLKRGKERFDIFCTHCHGAAGDGKGMIAQRGLELRRPPATYHTDRLREMPIGHFFDVITSGYGAMYPYASRVEPDDRWAIAAYIRALQHSQNAKASEIPQQEMSKMNSAATGGQEGGH
jgi:mono/diheme cytochrome c family protein